MRHPRLSPGSIPLPLCATCRIPHIRAPPSGAFAPCWRPFFQVRSFRVAFYFSFFVLISCNLKRRVPFSEGVQEFRSSGVQEFRSSGVQEFRSSGDGKETLCRLVISTAAGEKMPSPNCKEPPHPVLQLLNSCNSFPLPV